MGIIKGVRLVPITEGAVLVVRGNDPTTEGAEVGFVVGGDGTVVSIGL